MRRSATVLDFIERTFDIHGEFNGSVYHRKRNGELEKSVYEPVSYYQRTAKVIRSEWIRKYLCKYTNPGECDYSETARKFYYATPYILHCGEGKYLAETVFYVREKGDYELRWQDSPMGIKMKLSPRTEVKLNFDVSGEYLLQIYLNGELYCQRLFVITAEDLDEMYDNWLRENAESILLLDIPEYSGIKVYRRGLKSNVNWILSFSGKFDQEVLYCRSDCEKLLENRERGRPWVYHRRSYDHSDNMQTIEFDLNMAVISEAWNELTSEEKKSWNKQAFYYKKKRITGFNLFVSDYFK